MTSRCESLTYLDLFSGRGEYKDGTPSTPLLILDSLKELNSSSIFRKLQIYFCEHEKSLHAVLKNRVTTHEAFQLFTNEPKIEHTKVTGQILSEFMLGDCTYTFVDPFGYRGVTLKLLSLVIKNWGSDCVFYLSVSGIRRNVRLAKQAPYLTSLFGQEGFETLRNHVEKKLKTPPFHKLVIEKMTEALNKRQKTYVLPFEVEFSSKKGVSYYLVFLTKHHLGFKIMKDVMAAQSQTDIDGLPYYRFREASQVELPLYRRMDQLKADIMNDFGGQSMQADSFFVECHKKSYLAPEKLIRKALVELEFEAKLAVPVDGKARLTGTFGKDRVINFIGNGEENVH